MYSQTENLHVFKLFKKGSRMNQQELDFKTEEKTPTNVSDFRFITSALP